MKFSGTRQSAVYPSFAERSCADCTQYVPEVTMATKSDGRKVCKVCDRKSKDKAAEKSQLEFFGQQSLI